MIYERLLKLCNERGIGVSNLAEEITGSRGNLSTWKKGHIRSDYLVEITRKFNVSTDYLLCLVDEPRPLYTDNASNFTAVENRKENVVMNEKARNSLKELEILFGSVYTNCIKDLAGTDITPETLKDWAEHDFSAPPNVAQLCELLRIREGNYSDNSRSVFIKTIRDYEYYTGIGANKEDLDLSQEVLSIAKRLEGLSEDSRAVIKGEIIKREEREREGEPFEQEEEISEAINE